MLTAVFYIIKNRIAYHDLGAEHFTKRDTVHVTKRLVRRLEDLKDPGIIEMSARERPAGCAKLSVWSLERAHVGKR